MAFDCVGCAVRVSTVGSIVNLCKECTLAGVQLVAVPGDDAVAVIEKINRSLQFAPVACREAMLAAKAILEKLAGIA